MTLNARFKLNCALRTARLTYTCTFVAGFGFDRTHRCSQRGRGSGLEGLAPPCGQLRRCLSAVAELLVLVCTPSNVVLKKMTYLDFYVYVSFY